MLESVNSHNFYKSLIIIIKNSDASLKKKKSYFDLSTEKFEMKIYFFNCPMQDTLDKLFPLPLTHIIMNVILQTKQAKNLQK